jgi:hypothetical protein
MKPIITTLLLYLDTWFMPNNCRAQIGIPDDLQDTAKVRLAINLYRPSSALSNILKACVKNCKGGSLKSRITWILLSKKDTNGAYHILVYPTMDAGYTLFKKAYGIIHENGYEALLPGNHLPYDLAMVTKMAMVKTVSQPMADNPSVQIPDIIFDPQGPKKNYRLKIKGKVYGISTTSCK